jgi:ribose transport system ATP-binding protein
LTSSVTNPHSEADLATSETRLRARGVSVTFGRNRVLRDAAIDVLPGEIHGLIGQNGSGKSTLAKVLTGLYAPDAGASILIDGEALHLPVRPLEARERGVAVVHQSLGLIPEMTVLENMRIGRMSAGRFTRRIRWPHEREQALRVFERLDRSVPLDVAVSTLREEDRATVAIARALQDAEAGRGLIIFDESTRALSRRSLEHFYEMLGEVVATGTSALLITHRLEEIIEAADRVTVLRDGEVVESGIEVSGLGETELTRLMLGRNLGDIPTRNTADVAATSVDREAVKLIGIFGFVAKSVNLEIAPGEILGVTGLADSGYDELPYLLSGAVTAKAGRLAIGGKQVDLTRLDPAAATAAGIALVPEGREKSGLAMELTLSENAALAQPSTRKHGMLPIDRRAERAVLDSWIERVDVRPREPQVVVSTLSGGNQQKVMLAKWLAVGPKLLALHEPTQAVDVGARHTIVEAIRMAAQDGCAVLVAGSDENELTLLCDRVIVFRDGYVAEEIRAPFTPDDVVAATFAATKRNSLRQVSTKAS